MNHCHLRSPPISLSIDEQRSDDLTHPASPAMQRYAAEVYRLQEQRPYVGLAELAEHLERSAQAVSRMVQRLKEAATWCTSPTAVCA